MGRKGDILRAYEEKEERIRPQMDWFGLGGEVTEAVSGQQRQATFVEKASMAF